MQNTFEIFRDLFEERYRRISVLDLGEDSVRYDFFSALKESLNLRPWEIQLEHAVHPQSFKPRENAKRKRDEKPQIDLWFEDANQRVGVEFAIFKCNKGDGSRINNTEYIFKVLNDMMRLALNAELTNSKAYFVCIADSSMLGKQLRNKQLPAFPGAEYTFDVDKLQGLIDTMISAKKRLDERFIYKLREMNMKVTGQLVYDERVESETNPLETKALIWEIKWEKSL